MEKEFKYKEYLNKYKNCPGKDFAEKDFECFRWVHEQPSERNFLPVPFMRNVAPRKLENNDEGCEHYCLSVYKDLKSARDAYKNICDKALREEFVEKFKSNIGEYAAQLQIEKNDGVADMPNNRTGHFSFYEYTDCKLSDKIKGIFNIFV